MVVCGWNLDGLHMRIEIFRRAILFVRTMNISALRGVGESRPHKSFQQFIFASAPTYFSRHMSPCVPEFGYHFFMVNNGEQKLDGACRVDFPSTARSPTSRECFRLILAAW